MKIQKINVFIFYMSVSLCFIPQLGISQDTDTTMSFTEEFQPLWQRAEAYLIAVAEAMPEEQYNYKPTPEMFSFAGQMMHIVQNISWLNSTYISQETNPFTDVSAEGKSKQEIVQRLKDVFAYVNTTLGHFPEQQLKAPVRFGGEKVNKERIFYLMRDHTTHHRAQAIVYLRMKGIVPPKYVGW